MIHEEEQKQPGNDQEKALPANSFSWLNEKMTALWIDQLLGKLKSGYFADFFDKNEKWLTKYGLYGLYLLALLGLLASIVFPIRYEGFPWQRSLGMGIVWFLTCIVAHYIAYKLLPALGKIIKATPTKLSSYAFLECLAMIFGILGIISLLGGLYLWAKTSSFDSFLVGLLLFIACEYVFALCINPKLLNIEEDKQTTAGQEFIGLLSFAMKGFLRLIPIVFGAGVILGVFDVSELLFKKFEYMGEVIEKCLQIARLGFVVILPLIAYVLFLAYYFMIDLANAVLSVPAKLDALSKSETTKPNP
jgi:hypothetical protein